jgi:hypothetical protein
MRRENIYPHKSLRYMPFHNLFLWQGLIVSVVADILLVWQLETVLNWHARALQHLLNLASVPWETGREISILPNLSATLVRVPYLDYLEHPRYPWAFLGIALAIFLVGYRYWPAPLRPLLATLPIGLGITLVYLKLVSPNLPYSPEDFCALWYRGETYLWLLLPWVFGLGLFTLNVPFALKLPWLVVVFLYSVFWSVVRLALAVATFYYFGSMWMPIFYFLFGFLADFLYVVAFYSLAMDRAAHFLVKQKEVWQS